MCRYCRRSRTTGREALAVAAAAAVAAVGVQHAVTHAAVPKPSGAAAAAIRYVEARKGLPYCWGGTGPSCYDCSGLVMQAEAAAGVAIPRTTFTQWAQLPHVTRPRPGDLVYFAGSDGTPSKPGHVGMVIRPGYMVDAYGSGVPIQVQPFSDAGTVVGYARPGGA